MKRPPWVCFDQHSRNGLLLEPPKHTGAVLHIIWCIMCCLAPVMQGRLSMRTAVLSPDSIVTLLQVNMEQQHSSLDAMLADKSSSDESHWQLVAVSHSAFRGTRVACMVNTAAAHAGASISGTL